LVVEDDILPPEATVVLVAPFGFVVEVTLTTVVVLPGPEMGATVVLGRTVVVVTAAVVAGEGGGLVGLVRLVEEVLSMPPEAQPPRAIPAARARPKTRNGTSAKRARLVRGSGRSSKTSIIAPPPRREALKRH